MSLGYSAAASVTRANNTNAYTANDVIGVATGASISQAGYITIKDAAGTIRKLLVGRPCGNIAPREVLIATAIGKECS